MGVVLYQVIPKMGKEPIYAAKGSEMYDTALDLTTRHLGIRDVQWQVDCVIDNDVVFVEDQVELHRLLRQPPDVLLVKDVYSFYLGPPAHIHQIVHRFAIQGTKVYMSDYSLDVPISDPFVFLKKSQEKVKEIYEVQRMAGYRNLPGRPRKH